MSISPIIAFPSLAPLNSKAILHLLGENQDEFISHISSRDSELMNQLVWLKDRIGNARNALSQSWRQQSSISVNSIRESIVQRRGQSLSRQTFSDWYASNKLRRNAWGKLDLDNAGGIVISSQIMNVLREEQRRYYESLIAPGANKDDEILWCYRQAPPMYGEASPILPCPWPEIPSNLERGTLLMSNWTVFDASWVQFPGLGAVRFLGIDEQSLARWDATIPTQELQELFQMMTNHVSPEEGAEIRLRNLESFSQSLLTKFALSRLTQLPSFPDYSILWSHDTIWPNEVHIA